MKLSEFLSNIQKEQEEVVFYCCNHLLSKKFDVKNDEVSNDELKKLFVDYENFSKALNDSANIIYRKYESEIFDVYKIVCSLFNENFDNKYLFDYRLARVVNQEPKQFLDIEDKSTQETVIQKFEDKINAIIDSKYFKENSDSLAKELISSQKNLEIIKMEAGLN